MDTNSQSKEINSLSIKNAITSFVNIFSYEDYNEEFLKYLKKIEKPSNNVCAKLFSENEKAFHCEECGKYESSIICMECYENNKEFHKDHTISLENDVEGGCCDCGNPDVWEEKGFCSLHKGFFVNEEDINNFIKENFNDDIIRKITKWISDIINLLIPYFLEMEKNDNIYNNENLNEIMKLFLKFLSDIFHSNSGLLHLFSKNFIKNYPYKTFHNCVIINNKNEVKINFSNGEEHLCQCSFLKILLSVWTDKIECESLLFSLLQNNKMKISIGLIYIAIYDKILNNNASDLYYFINQVISSDIILNSIKEPYLIINLVKSFYNKLEQCIVKNDLQLLENIIKNFHNDIHYLLREQTIELFIDKIELFEDFINIIEFLNNINNFEIVFEYQKEGFSLSLFSVEYGILDLFLYLISYFNFNNLELTKKLFKIYEEKFNNYKFLQTNSFSFHIILVRSFTIILNRFCFFYSIKNNSNFYNSMKYIIQLVPNCEKIFEILIKETMKFFGFLLSIESNYFIYYGEDMKKYIKMYFEMSIFHLIDFNTIQLMLCLEQNKKYFSINQIFELCSVNNSNVIMKVFFNLDNQNFDFIQEENDEKKNKLNKKILEYFIKFIRDNSSIFDLFDYPFQYKKKNKIKDDLVKYLFENEKNSIDDILKEKIVNFSIIKENLYIYSDLTNIVYNNIFDEKLFQEIIEEMTNKIIQNNGQFKFCLKNIFLKNFDNDYILEAKDMANAQRFIIDFQKQNISLLNYYFYEPLKILKELNIHIYYNFFYYNNNIELLINIAINLISKIEYKYFSELFLFSVLKLILIFMYIDKNIITDELKKEKEEFYNNIKNKINELLDKLNDNNITNDDDRKLLYKFLEINILKYLNIEKKENDEEKNKIKNEDNKKKLQDKKNKLLDKYKKKFQVKNLAILKANIEEKNEESENCILCHIPLLNNESNDIFGMIGTNVKDFFIKHCKKLSIKNEFEKYNKNKEINFSSFYDNKNEINIRLFSCNHKIHFECYNQLIINILSFSEQIEFDCPLCKVMGNLFIPCVNFYYNNNVEIFSNLLSEFKINNFFDENFILKEKLNDNIFIDSSNIKIQNILNSSISFIENFFDGKLITFLNNPNNFPFCFNILMKEFSNFLIYYDISDYNNSQKDIWTNLILCLRILLKTKILAIDKFLLEFNNIITFFKNGKIEDINMIQIFFNNIISELIDKILFICLILFDLENIEQFFIDLFYPYILIISYIKQLFLENNFILSPIEIRKSFNVEAFNIYINNNKAQLNEIVNNFLKKINIFSLINSNKKSKNKEENNVIINLYQKLNENKSISELILKLNENLLQNKNESLNIIFKNKINNDKIIEIIFQNFSNTFENISIRYFINQNMLLFGIKLFFKFIPLEKSLLEHISKIQNEKCICCGKNSKLSLLCLLCGEKFCYDKLCKPKENNPNNKCYYEIHSINCNYGNICYITELGKILFFYHMVFVNSFNGIYLNQFGERLNDNDSITNDYKLVEKEYQKIEKMFIDFSYRKKI